PKAVTEPDFLPLKEVAKFLDALDANAQKETQTRRDKLSRWLRDLTSGVLPFTLQEQIRHLLQSAIEALEKAQDYVSRRRAILQSHDAFQQLTQMLANFAQSPCWRTLEGHTNWVWSVSFSPDGQILASGSYDDTVKLWRVSDGRLLRTLVGHTSGVSSVSFSPDGQILASGSYDKTVKLWRVSDGRLLRTLVGHTDRVWSVSFSPDGQILASGGGDKTIKLWWDVREWEVPKDEARLEMLLEKLKQIQQRRQEERRKREEERRMREIKAQRRAQGLCEECGQPLSFWDKLLGRTKCPRCR
ncbi:MAG: WD40 repeat domain-containing protein, partial [Armatimonadota bacterium]